MVWGLRRRRVWILNGKMPIARHVAADGNVERLISRDFVEWLLEFGICLEARGGKEYFCWWSENGKCEEILFGLWRKVRCGVKLLQRLRITVESRWFWEKKGSFLHSREKGFRKNSYILSRSATPYSYRNFKWFRNLDLKLKIISTKIKEFLLTYSNFSKKLRSTWYHQSEKLKRFGIVNQ